MLQSLFAGLLDLLAPAACSACDQPVETREAAFCVACEPLLEPAPVCEDPNLRAVYHYGGPVADAIWRLKYGGRSEIARVLGPPLVERAASWVGQLDIVTAVPVSGAKLRARGYNQSGLLAQGLARGLGLPFRPHWFTRKRAGQRQVGQNRAVRLAQIQGAFAASPKLRGMAVLVVDDVRTTGATLREARRALLEAGARSVFLLVLAQADDRS